MRWQWDFGLGRELGYAFWALTFFEATLGAYLPVWPIWIERLGAPITVVGLVLGLSGLIRPFVLGPGSWLLDKYDTRRILIIARSISILGLILAAFAGSWPVLLITIVTSAIGEIVFPAIQTYVADHAGDDPVHAFNMVITIGPAGALILAPLVSGVIITFFGIPGAIILACLLTATALGFVSRMHFGVHASSPMPTTDPATYRTVFASSAMRRIILLHGFTIASLAIGSALMSNFLEVERGLRPSLITLISAGAAVGTITMGLVSIRVRRLKQSPILAASIATTVVAIGYLTIATQPALVAITLGYVMRGGLFSAWAFFLAEMSHRAPAHLRSRGFAVVEILGGSAMSFGPIIAAQLWIVDPRLPFFVSAALALPVAVACFVVATRERSPLLSTS